MKNFFKHIVVLVISALLFNCSDELDNPRTDFNNASLFTSDTDLTASGAMDDPFIIPQNYPIPFTDISVGSVNREWSITRGGNFLRSFTDAETNGNFSRFIDTSLDTISTAQTIHVLFKQSGLNVINFKANFKDSTALKLRRVFEPLTFEAPVFDEEKGLFEVNTTFYFDVLEEVNPSFRVLDEEGNVVVTVNPEDDFTSQQSAEFANITIEAGSKLVYEDISAPSFLRSITDQNRQWNLPNGNPMAATGERVEVFYNNLGVTRQAGTFTHARVTETDILNGRKVKVIPLQITVVPSTKPYVIVADATTLTNGKEVNIRLSGLVETVSDTSVDNFELTSPSAGSLTINSIEIDETDASKIKLILDERIPVADIGSNLTFSYEAPMVPTGESPALSQIISNDTRNLESTSTPIEIAISSESYGLNRLTTANNGDIYSIEAENTNANVNFAGATGFFAIGNSARTPTPWFRSTEQANSGNASMKFSSDNGVDTADGGRLLYSFFGDPTGHPAGKYLLSFYIYIESGDNLSQIRLIPNASGLNVDFDVSSIEKGKWVELAQEIDLTEDVLGPFSLIPAGPDRERIRLDLLMPKSLNPSATGNVRLYIDDISFIALD